jgi:hypothetical protein
MTSAHPPNSTAASTAPASRPTFVLEFRAEPGIDAIKSIRALLKFAGRRLGLRAVDARENLEGKS